MPSCPVGSECTGRFLAEAFGAKPISFREVLAAYRKAAAIWEKLAADGPGTPDWRHNLAVSHERIGDVLAAEGFTDSYLYSAGRSRGGKH